MKTSTPTFQLSGWFGEDVAIEMIAKAGFDAFDYSLHEIISFDWKNLKSTVNTKHPYFQNDYNKHLKMLKRVAEDNGIVCNQSHAPFPLFDKAVEGELKKCIEATAELGGEIIIIHPDKSLKLEENIEVYSELLPFAKSHGVKIACENMFDWRADLGYAVPKACGTKEDFVAHLNALNDPYFVACLDIGHAEMMKDGTCAVDMIKALGTKLKALHIHDNDKTHDNHQMPFTMDIKYKPIVKALKEVGYNGYFTLEADNYTRMIGREKAQQGQIDLKKSLDKLIKMYNNA
jgi:sugar phosphate isomerase/epimerase